VGAPAPPAARRPAGALGADFRRQVSSPAPADPEPPASEQWHVAIDEAPVGPLSRTELGRKVASGAVRGDSLVWREGFDDWRALREVTELAGLLSEDGSGWAMPPTHSQRPTERPVPPIGGRQGAAAAAPDPAPSAAPHSLPAGMLRESDGAPTSPPAAPSSAPLPAAPAEAAEERTRPKGPAIPVGGWIAIAGAMAFGVASAVMVVGKWIEDDGGRPVAAAVEAETEPASEAEEGSAQEADMALTEEDLEEEGDEGDEAPPEGDDDADEEAETPSARKRTARRPRSAKAGSSKDDEQLSAEQRKTLERFSGESGAAPSDFGGDGEGSGGQAQGGKGLDARKLSGVVRENRPELVRCYEKAIRGMGDPPTVRMDVDVTVGMSGTVTRVRARGNDVAGLRDCIERSVRRWRFPSSGSETRTSFPVVFQPGGG
ncbi:MAG: GYF domain-containing protein, partial [Myxococcota bacterium]